MKTTTNEVLAWVQDRKVESVDVLFTDLLGREHRFTMPAQAVNAGLFETGKLFDGSSVPGWQSIHESDMLLKADASSAVFDPFSDIPTLQLRSFVCDPRTQQRYDRDPRSIASKAEAYMTSSGMADVANFGPEPEFFIFDEVSWHEDMSGAAYHIQTSEAAWMHRDRSSKASQGHKPGVKGGYWCMPPLDHTSQCRQDMAAMLERMKVVVEGHHHEVATAGQNEICTRFNSLLSKADEMQIFKYVVHQVAAAHGKTATFMPKPLVGDNGSGMHCHVSLCRGGQNLFQGEGYSNLSPLALHFMGGIIAHAKSLNAFTNPTINSYRRLVPGFEAPVLLTYAACNRSAAIRIPHTDPGAERIEVRFPDPSANPYLAFSAILMAGLDGIRRELSPGQPWEENLYELSGDALKNIPTVCGSLEEALLALEQDHAYLLEGQVFSRGLLERYAVLKREDIDRLRFAVHPAEFAMYYSC